MIPQAVYEEIVVQGAGQPGASEVAAGGWIQVEAVHDQTAVLALHQSLDQGEAEAITLAAEHLGSLLVMDERLGRLTAMQMGLNVVGLLGILLIAKRKSLVIAIGPLLDQLEKSAGFRMSTRLKADVLREAGEVDVQGQKHVEEQE